MNAAPRLEPRPPPYHTDGRAHPRDDVPDSGAFVARPDACIVCGSPLTASFCAFCSELRHDEPTIGFWMVTP